MFRCFFARKQLVYKHLLATEGLHFLTYQPAQSHWDLNCTMGDGSSTHSVWRASRVLVKSSRGYYTLHL